MGGTGGARALQPRHHGREALSAAALPLAGGGCAVVTGAEDATLREVALSGAAVRAAIRCRNNAEPSVRLACMLTLPAGHGYRKDTSKGGRNAVGRIILLIMTTTAVIAVKLIGFAGHVNEQICTTDGAEVPCCVHD